MNLVVGHKHTKAIFIKAKENNRIAHCYLLHGRESIGKILFAMETGRMLRCTNKSNYNNCNCQPCSQYNNNGGELQTTLIQQENLSIRTVKDIINPNAQLAVAHNNNSWNIIVIENIHLANNETANAMLKTLEEPGEHTVIFLTTSSLNDVLPTIISRSTVVPMQTLSHDNVNEIYKQIDQNQDQDQDHHSLQQKLRDELYDGTMGAQKIDATIYFQTCDIVENILNGTPGGVQQMLDLLWKLDDKLTFRHICTATYKKCLDNYSKNMEHTNIIMFADHILELLNRCDYNINLETVKFDFLSKLATLAPTPHSG